MSALANVTAVSGVLAAALFDDRGRCVEHVGAPAYDRETMVRAMRELDEVTAILSSSYDTAADGGVTTLYIDATQGWLAVRRLDDHAVLCLGREAPNRAMLRVALTAAAARLRGEPTTGKRTRPSTADILPLREARPVGLPVVKALLVLLKQSLGPAAKPALTRELKALGATPKSLGREAFPYLIEQLAVRITNPTWQDVFRSEAARLLD